MVCIIKKGWWTVLILLLVVTVSNKKVGNSIVGDTNNDGCVSTTEFYGAVTNWKIQSGGVTDQVFPSIITYWKNKVGCVVVSDGWEPYLHPNAELVKKYYFSNELNYLCYGNYCVLNDIKYTCGNHKCDFSEDQLTCPKDCSCIINGEVDRTKVDFANNKCTNPSVYFVGYDKDLGSVKKFFKEVVGVSTSPTSDEGEIWDRTKKVYNWFSTHKLKSGWGECQQYSQEKTVQYVGEWNYQGYAIQTVPDVYERFGGLCYGACTSYSHAFATYLLVAGIPEDRVITTTLNSEITGSDHVYNGLRVGGGWVYIDFMCGGAITGETPHSVGCGRSSYAYADSAKDVNGLVLGVPLLEENNKKTVSVNVEELEGWEPTLQELRGY